MAANGFGWLLYASDLGGEHQGGRGTTAAAIDEKYVWHAFLLVFSVLFYMDANTIIAENRLRCIIYDNVM